MDNRSYSDENSFASCDKVYLFRLHNILDPRFGIMLTAFIHADQWLQLGALSRVSLIKELARQPDVKL